MLLFLIIGIRKAQRLRFLALYFLYERRHGPCTKKGKTKNDFRFIVFPFMYEKTHKTEKQKSTSVSSFSVFCTNKHMKTEKRQINFFLSIFLLCTKTHKNIPTEIDFRSIVFRCKYNQSVKERPGYSSFSLAV